MSKATYVAMSPTAKSYRIYPSGMVSTFWYKASLSRKVRDLFAGDVAVVSRGGTGRISKKGMAMHSTLDQIESDRYKEAQVGTLPVLHSL